jgi:hypothetical protein
MLALFPGRVHAECAGAAQGGIKATCVSAAPEAPFAALDHGVWVYSRSDDGGDFDTPTPGGADPDFGWPREGLQVTDRS